MMSSCSFFPFYHKNSEMLALCHISYVFHWANFWTKCGRSWVEVGGQGSKWTVRGQSGRLDWPFRYFWIVNVNFFSSFLAESQKTAQFHRFWPSTLFCRIRAWVNVQVSFQVNGQKGNYGQSILWIIQFRTRSEIVRNCPRRSSVQLWKTLLN